MNDFIVKVYKAKRFLLELFPFSSSTILYIPVKKGKTLSSVLFTKYGIVINQKFEKISEIAFLLTSAGIMYNFALNKRIKGFYKVIYYLASALYANEVSYDLYESRGILYSRSFLTDNHLECYDTFSTLLYPEVKSREDLLKLSVEDIYRILLNKLKNAKEDIERLIVLAYKGLKNSNEFKKSREKLVRYFFNLIRNLGLDLKVEAILKNSEILTNLLLSAIERYIHEYKGLKESPKLFKNLKYFSESFSIKGADNLKDYYENLLNLSKYYLPTFSNMLRLFSQIVTEYKNIMGRYIYNKIPNRFFVYKKISNVKIIIPKYDKIPTIKLYVALDSSGSISDKEYELFVNALSYLVENLKNIEGKILIFSSDILAKIPFASYNSTKIFDILKRRKGYGGTVFNSVIEELKKEKDLSYSYLIVFTDGIFYDRHSLDIKTLEKLRRIIFVTTSTVPDLISKLKNVKIVKIS